MGSQPPEVRSAIAAMGQVLGPDVLKAVYSLFGPEQNAMSAVPAVADIAYGPHQRQQLDLYRPADGDGPHPVLLWVHGGGFLRGEKSAPDHPFNAHVGRWAARCDMIGAVTNYRLVPDGQWPSGGEDVALAIRWLRDNVARHGGDPDRIFIMGTSAGAVHIATLLRLDPHAAGARAAILLSALYGFTPLDERDTLYYGAADLYADRMPRDAVVQAAIPLFVACAEFDPPRFQRETVGLLQACLDQGGKMPRGMIVPGHNHFSLACHIGGADTRLSDEILAFIRDQH